MLLVIVIALTVGLVTIALVAHQQALSTNVQKHSTALLVQQTLWNSQRLVLMHLLSHHKHYFAHVVLTLPLLLLIA